MYWWLAYIGLGVFTGFSAGMLGIGGGLVMVPVLTMLFAAQAEFPINEVLHLALGTSIATILFTSLASLRAHHQHDAGGGYGGLDGCRRAVHKCCERHDQLL